MTTAYIPLVVISGDNLVVGLTTGREVDVALDLGGEPLLFRGGLTRLDLPDEVYEVTGSSGQVGLTVDLDVCDLAALRRAGTRLQALEIAVYAWAGEPSLDQSVELYRGVARAPSIDYAGRLCDLTVSEPTRIADVAFPPASVSDPGRFTVLPDSTKAATVPVIYGRVAAAPLITLGPTGGSVLMLICGHECYGKPGAPGTVDVYRVAETEDGGGASDQLVAAGASVLTVRDGLGDVYSAVLVPSANWSESGMFVAPFIGMLSSYQQPIEGLGDALDHMIRTYGRENWRELDRGRTETARAALNRFQVGILANDRQTGDSLLSMLANRIGGQFPVAFGAVGGRFGWDAILQPDDAEAAPALELTYGVNAFARSAVDETDATEVRNRFRLEWGYSGATSKPANVYSRDADNDDRCRASQTRWGASAEVQFSAPDAADAATAALLCDEQIRRLSEIRDMVSYLVTEPRILRIPRGAVVAVTDAAPGWTRRRFVLTARKASGDGTISISLVSIAPAGLGPGVDEATRYTTGFGSDGSSSGGSISSGGG